ncbi:MAG: protein-L-isoaspartate O-methyltransferase [Candidatus Andersenbacteria bacterium]
MNTPQQNLLRELINTGVLKTPHIIAAFAAIDRAHFVPPERQAEAYHNIPLPISQGQTISQPLTVAFMLELLQPQYGDAILDVGSGSGWQTVLLAYIVSHAPPHSPAQKNPGKIFAVEVIPELAARAKGNLDHYRYLQDGIVTLYTMNASQGLPQQAPFDKIIAAASAPAIPDAWKKQLKPGGKIVAPVGHSIAALTKKSDTLFHQEEYPGFIFVPFVENHQLSTTLK